MNKSKRRESTGIRSVRSLRNIPPTLRFVLGFAVLVTILGATYAAITVYFEGPMLWLARLTASLTGGLGEICSDNITTADRFVGFHDFRVEIIDECTGVLEMLIFTAAVLAFPTTWRKRLIGIAAGIPAIYLFNIVRIIVLLIAGASSRAVFDFMHLYFWQVTLIIIIASIWLAWLYLVVLREDKTALAVSE